MAERKLPTRRRAPIRSLLHESLEKRDYTSGVRHEDDSVTTNRLIEMASKGEKIGTADSVEHPIGGHDTTDRPRD